MRDRVNHFSQEKPRDVAQKLLDELKPAIKDTFEEPEIAGPGFLNLRYARKPAAAVDEDSANSSALHSSMRTLHSLSPE